MNSKSSVVKIDPARIPQSLMQPCHEPVNLPDRGLDSGEVARLWAADRLSLGECGRGKRALVDAINAQRSGT